MKIVPGPASIELSKKLASILELDLVRVRYKTFYDGETYMQIEDNIENEQLIIVQSTYPPQEKHFMELLLLGETLKDLGAKKVTALVPYLCYARADKRKLSGEVMSHQISLNLLSKSGIDKIITVNVHNPEAFLSSADKLQKENINLFSYLGQDLAKKYEGYIVIGPDKGAEIDVKTLSKYLNADYFVMEKYRDAVTQKIAIKTPEVDLEGKKVLLIDDIITSGGTAKRAAEIILANNPSKLVLLFIHALSKNEVYDQLKSMGVSEIISTDTIPLENLKQIDIAPYLANYIQENIIK